MKLESIDVDNTRRREIAQIYCSEIKNPLVRLPVFPDDALSHVWHLFVVRVERRESLLAFLKAAGVQTLIHYPKPPHLQNAYRGVFDKSNFLVTEKIHQEVLSLPIGPTLKDHDIRKVVEAVNAWN